MKTEMKWALAGLTVISFSLQACKKSQQEKNADSIEQLLESDGSGNWTEVKVDSRIKSFAVFKGPDGKYYAFNTGAYDGSSQTKAEFLAKATVYSDLGKSTDTIQTYGVIGSSSYYSYSCPTSWSDESISCSAYSYDINGNVTQYSVNETDYGYTTTYEDIYTDRASGLVFQVGDTASKDLESVSASIEASSNEALREQLVSGYGLTENRATEIASLAKSWQNISKSRAMTSKDLIQFQSKVFGTDLNTLKNAATKSANGDNKDYDALIKKAAQMNDVSPEQAKAIFKDFLN